MIYEYNPEVSPYTIMSGVPAYTFEGSTGGMSIPVQSPLPPMPPPLPISTPPIVPQTIFMSGDIVECIGVRDENNGPHKQDYGGCGAGWSLGKRFTIKEIRNDIAWPVEDNGGVYLDHIKLVKPRPKNMIVVPGIGGEATNRALLYVSNKLYSFLYNKSVNDNNSGHIYLLGKSRNQKGHNTAIDCIRVKYDGGCRDSNRANPNSILEAIELLSEFDSKPLAICIIRSYLDAGTATINIDRLCREYNDLAMVLFTNGVQIVWKGGYRSLLGIRKSL